MGICKSERKMEGDGRGKRGKSIEAQSEERKKYLDIGKGGKERKK